MEAKFNLLLVTALLFPFFPFQTTDAKPFKLFLPLPFRICCYLLHTVRYTQFCIKAVEKNPEGIFFTFQEWIVPCQGAQ